MLIKPNLLQKLYLSTIISAFFFTFLGTAKLSAEYILEPVVVTGRAKAELQHKSPATIWVIDEEQIEKSHSESVTDLLAESAAGFFSTWTPGQTSINIRGGATDGQGKDFKSQVMVLINGRRAGTANLSKLSPNDVHKIEIIRGPASVAYGSQSIGGVINIILKNGRNSNGGAVDSRIGSAGLAQVHAQYAHTWGSEDELATYFSAGWGRKSDYTGGKGAGIQKNTQWKRFGAMASADWQINEQNSLDFLVRTDGIYDVGFRGSGANRYSKDDRTNQSIDLNWNYQPQDLPFKWNLHTYMIYDEDYLKWASPRSRPGSSKDYNKRKLSIVGLKFQPVINLSESNELMLGIDLEESKLRSDRERRNLQGNLNPVNPIDLNQSEKTLALYIEDTQKLFNDDLILRGGVRYNYGETKIDYTPNLHNQVLGNASYNKITWSTGLNYMLTDNLSFKAGASTGFRAPTATEMTGQVSFLNTPDQVTYGNKNIKPETSMQYEIGLASFGTGWRGDISLFQNTVKNRIISKRLNSKSSMFANNEGAILVKGMETAAQINLNELLDWEKNKLSMGFNFNYNFKMLDKARYNRNRTEPDRIYKYQGSVYTEFGQLSEHNWSVRFSGLLRGPVYYDTEENLKRPKYEPNNLYIHRKGSFWVFNTTGQFELSESWLVYAGINNIFNKNQHPLFIAIDDGQQYLNNPNDGGYGTSMPGREFYIGLKYSF